MLRPWGDPHTGEIDDRELASYLASEALLELRRLASRAERLPEGASAREHTARIRELAEFAQAMLALSVSPPRQPAHGTPTRRDQAMWERPMSYRWGVLAPERRAWVLRRVERAGLSWTPPPPLPSPRKGVPELSPGQRLGLLAGWPVKPPPGRRPLPRPGRVLKLVDREAVLALHEEADRLRPGRNRPSRWLYAHLDPGAAHYLFPDPAAHDWPDPDAGRSWWRCGGLLRMADGEQVNGSLLVLPETFAALPSTVPRVRQRRLALISRLTERDVYLWGRDHEPHCAPEACGYAPGGDGDGRPPSI
ncbi:hypothetical protein [Streptomyces sp. NPDC020141]|uniref:hypothetical protein n=1 Tax=Streptomyces sp. NPDC020141 TaxID=3365065 RepID=UPI0037B02F46